MTSFEKIFNDKIEEFKSLKDQYNNIIKLQKSFDYNWKLSTLKDNRERQLAELEKNEIFTEDVKQVTKKAIELEFLKSKKQLDVEYEKICKELSNILSQNQSLKNDPKYQEAMKIRSKYIQAKSAVNIADWNKLKAERELDKANADFELAKQNLELAKQKLEREKQNVNIFQNILDEKKLNYIKNTIDKDEVDKCIINTIIEFVSNWLNIEKNKLVRRPLIDVIKNKIFYWANISRQWAWIKEIDEIVQFSNVPDYNLLKVGDKITIDCTFWTDWDKIWEKIEVTIIWDGDDGIKKENNDKVNTPTDQHFRNNRDEPVKPELHKETQNLSDDEKHIVDYINNMNKPKKNSKYDITNILIWLKNSVKDIDNKWLPEEYYSLIKLLSQIYEEFNKKDDVIKFILEEIPNIKSQFKLNNFLENYNSVKKFLEAIVIKIKDIEKKDLLNRLYASLKYFKEEDKQTWWTEKQIILTYCLYPFWLTPGMLGIDDLPKTWFCSGGWCDWNGRWKRRH